MQPKILFYDIETAPNLSYVWGHYQQDVIAHEREWYVLCFAWRWGHQKKVHAISLPDFPKAYANDPENDLHVVKKLHELFEEADIIVAHNGDKFDYKKAKVITLEQNYRSTGKILEASNHLIKHNKKRKEKTLWTKNKDGASPMILNSILACPQM